MSPNGGGGSKVKFWLKVLAPVLASIAGLATLRLLGPDFLDQKTLRGFLAPLGVWAPVVFILLLGVRPVTLLPGQVFTAVGGILFGVALGTAYALAGSLLATGLVFVLARKFGTRVLKRFAGDQYDAVQITARRHDFKVSAIVTLNPLFPTDVMVAMAGASGARFWPTAFGLLLGTLPGTVLTAYFGAALSEGKTIGTIVSAVAIIISMVIGVFVGRKVMADFSAAKKNGTANSDGDPDGDGDGDPAPEDDDHRSRRPPGKLAVVR